MLHLVWVGIAVQRAERTSLRDAHNDSKAQEDHSGDNEE